MTVLGLDLDGVCGDYAGALRRHVSQTRGLDPATLPDPTSWSFTESGWPFADTSEYFAAHSDAARDGMFATMEPLPGVSEALWALSDAGVYIKVVTHRLCVNGFHAKVASDTVAWLDERVGPVRDGVRAQRVPFRDICFTEDKAKVGADIYIDDAPHNVRNLREAGMHTIVFDQPYNRDIDGPRARNWAEAAQMILEIHNS